MTDYMDLNPLVKFVMCTASTCILMNSSGIHFIWTLQKYAQDMMWIWWISDILLHGKYLLLYMEIDAFLIFERNLIDMASHRDLSQRGGRGEFVVLYLGIQMQHPRVLLFSTSCTIYLSICRYCTRLIAEYFGRNLKAHIACLKWRRK